MDEPVAVDDCALIDASAAIAPPVLLTLAYYVGADISNILAGKISTWLATVYI